MTNRDHLRDDVEPRERPTLPFLAPPRSGMHEIPIEDCRPRADQPRQHFDEASLEELAASIRQRGILQPIRVRPADGGMYEIIAGERRWRAARMAGRRGIPAVIIETDDHNAYLDAVIENIQREDLKAVDRAQALKRIRVTLGLQSWEDTGNVIGISRVHVQRLLAVTRLPEYIREDPHVADLVEKHARALNRLRAEPERQRELWEQITGEGLSGEDALARCNPRVTPPALTAALKWASRASADDITEHRDAIEQLQAACARLLSM